MENKRCTNCGFFPFCNYNKREENGKDCEEWKKREIEMKIVNKNGEIFEFKEIK